MKRCISVFFALVFILLSFTSCEEETETVLYYPVAEDFGTIDPQIASVASSKIVAYNCFEGLARIDKDGNVIPAGADSWTVSPDSLTYTFYLRQNAKWYLTNTSKEELSDPDPEISKLPSGFDTRVTAKDYKFGLQRALDPQTSSADGKYLSAIKNGAAVLNGEKPASELGIKVINDYTLEITLERADPNFLYYLTRLAAMPCNEVFFNACKGRYGLAMEYLLCNGEYIVYRWAINTFIRLEKNPLYTGSDIPLNDRVWIYYVADASSVPQKIEKGNYDAGYISADGLSLFNDKFTVKAISDVLWGYWFNTEDEAFMSASMRKAFASATDKTLLIQPEYIEGKTDRLLTNATSPYYDFTPSLIPYNEEKAAEYYKAAALENENISASMPVTVLTSENFADSVKKQIQIWQRVFGLDVKIEILPRTDAVKKLKAGNYQIAFLPVSVTATNTDEYFRTFKSDSTYNITGYKDENYDKLADSIAYSMSDEQKNSVFKKCEQQLIDNAVVIPAFTEASYFITGKDVTGIYTFSWSEVYFRYGTITKG